MKTGLTLFAPFGIVLFCLVVAFFVTPDFGVSWDEGIQRDYGLTVWNAVVHGQFEALAAHSVRYYGPVIPFLYVAIEKGLGLTDFGSVILANHYAGVLLYWVGVLVFYYVAFVFLRTRSWALLATLFFAWSPLTLGHSFFNPKDIAFMVFCIFCMGTLLFWYRKFDSYWRLLLHAMMVALCVDVRVLGVIWIPITVLFLLLAYPRLFANSIHRGWRLPFILGGRMFYSPMGIMIWRGLLFLVSSLMLVGVFWPTLWSDPMASFLNAFEQMSRYPWRGQVLFLGTVYWATSLPIYYPLVWIFITVPMVIGLGFLLAQLGFFIRILRFIWCIWNRCLSDTQLIVLVLMSWFWVPIVAIVIFDSVLYDGWRQLFFIYPAMVLLAMFAFYRFFSRFGKRDYLGLLVLWGALCVMLFQVIRYHPYHYVYFNGGARWLLGPNLEQSFDMDYWGVSYQTGLAYLLAHAPEFPITLFLSDAPTLLNYMALPAQDRIRIQLTERFEEAHYFMTTHRLVKSDYHFPQLFRLEKNGGRLLAIYEIGN